MKKNEEKNENRKRTGAREAQERQAPFLASPYSVWQNFLIVAYAASFIQPDVRRNWAKMHKKSYKIPKILNLWVNFSDYQKI
jgi:hypothetical protein